MPNLTLWLGALAAAAIMSASLLHSGAARGLLEARTLLVVLGGTISAVLIGTPASQILSALKAVFAALTPRRVPAPEEIAAEVARLSRLAHARGGLLGLKGESTQFAGGFLQRSISSAAACADTLALRDILEIEVRRLRSARREDANVLRALGAYAPMFGMMGALLGMTRAVQNAADPAALGPAMAAALASAFAGIGAANLLCLPLAGQIRLLALRETQAMEMMIEGVLAIAMNEPAYQVELRMAAYLSPAPTGGARGAA